MYILLMSWHAKSTLGLFLLIATTPSGAQDGIHWPSFRGAAGSGVADGYPTPERWDLATAQNVRWKTAIPGLAHSSPVIWGDRIFVTTVVSRDGDDSLKVGLYGDIEPVEDEAEYAFRVMALDKKTGNILWSQLAVRGVPRIKRHPKATHATKRRLR